MLNRTRDALRRQRSYDARPCLRRPVMLYVARDAIMLGTPEMPYKVLQPRQRRSSSIPRHRPPEVLSLPAQLLAPFDLFGLVAPLVISLG